MWLIVAAQIDVAMGLNAVCRTAAIAFYTANEAISVLENASALGIGASPRSWLMCLRAEGLAAWKAKTEGGVDEVKTEDKHEDDT